MSLTLENPSEPSKLDQPSIKSNSTLNYNGFLLPLKMVSEFGTLEVILKNPSLTWPANPKEKNKLEKPKNPKTLPVSPLYGTLSEKNFSEDSMIITLESGKLHLMENE